MSERKKVEEMDMFEENERSEMKLTFFPVIFENTEIDASKVDFADNEATDFAFEMMRTAGVL